MPGRTLKRKKKKEEPSAGLSANPTRSEKTLTALHEAFINSGSQYPLSQFQDALGIRLKLSPDPDMTLNNLLRFVEAAVSKASLFNDLLHYPVLFEVAVSLFGHSQYFSDILVRDPELFRWLTASDVLSRAQASSYYGAEIVRIEQTFAKPERRLDAFRRFYRREILRVGTRDILGIANLPTLTREISDLADSLINASYVLAFDQLKERYGHPPEALFAIIGLGKLGGRELNYSSDIDIMFVYEKEGERGKPSGADYSFHEYFNRLSERIVQNLSNSSSEGHIYRVDTRLRPESGAGPLARSLASCLLYYESRGELWERQMLVKGRPVGGSLEFGRTFLDQLQPFIYPRTFFSSPLEAAARLKHRIESGQGVQNNIKLMPGGIRDIEFIAQSLQLLNGGRIPEVRKENTLEALQSLAAAGLLSADEKNVLAGAYVFYRNLEHRLQMVQNTQTHTMPRDQEALDTLARRLGLGGKDSLGSVLNDHLRAVRRIFEQVLSSGGQSQPVPEIASVLDGGMREEEMDIMLRRYRFEDLRKGSRTIKALMFGTSLTGAKALDGRVRDAFKRVAGRLFEEIAETPCPDLSLSNLATLASAQQFPEQFYGQLEEERSRKLILRLCAMSPRLVKGLARQPDVLEELLSGLTRPGPTVLDGDPTDEFLREFKNRNELLAGSLHVLGLISFDELTEMLSATADAVVGAVLRGLSKGPKLKDPPLAVFALGKYGTRELIFDADLDLVFVCDGGAAVKARLETMAQQIVGSLQRITDRGKLYDVDARLRPEGKSAPLVMDAGAYLKYLQQRASLWERQSLTRLRCVCGRQDLAGRIMEGVSKLVYDAPLPRGWPQAIVKMRMAMETRSRSRARDFLDFKLGAGGMVDVEFAAQMLQLRCGANEKGIRGKRTREVLTAAPRNLMSGVDSESLIGAYQFYRELEKLLRLTLEEKGTILPGQDGLALLAKCLNDSGPEQMRERVLSTMRKVRGQFLEVAKNLSED